MGYPMRSPPDDIPMPTDHMAALNSGFSNYQLDSIWLSLIQASEFLITRIEKLITK